MGRRYVFPKVGEWITQRDVTGRVPLQHKTDKTINLIFTQEIYRIMSLYAILTVSVEMG